MATPKKTKSKSSEANAKVSSRKKILPDSSSEKTPSRSIKTEKEKDLKKEKKDSLSAKVSSRKTLTSSSVPKVRIIVKSFDYTVVDEASKAIVDTAERGGSLVSGPIPLPTKIKKFTVNRSFFIDKNARDQYEMRIHKRLLDIKEPTPQTIESLQNLSLPAGVDIEIKMMSL